LKTGASFLILRAMPNAMNDSVRILHDRVPDRIRLRVALIKHRATLAEVLKHSLLKDPDGHGIYHAEANVVTGSLLIKFHPSLQTQRQVVDLVRATAERIAEGDIPATAKHRNPRVSKMLPGAYFSRELLVSVAGNVIAGLVLAAFIAR
jgi:hypothetical protein